MERYSAGVHAWEEPVVIRTYPAHPAEKLPMFLDRRVYLGSSGKVARGYFEERLCLHEEAEGSCRKAKKASSDYCFPARIEEMLLLEAALRRNPEDGRAHYYLGNLLYDKKRKEEAIQHWEAAAGIEPAFSINWRNLGVAYFNVHADAARAVDSYRKAQQADPANARLFYEFDQLRKRIGIPPERAISGQYAMAHFQLGREAPEEMNPEKALFHFDSACKYPENLGEGKHLLTQEVHLDYFSDDLQKCQRIEGFFLRGLAQLGMGHTGEGPLNLEKVADLDKNHQWARAELSRARSLEKRPAVRR